MTPAAHVIHRRSSPTQAICRASSAPGSPGGRSTLSRRHVAPPSRLARTSGPPVCVSQPTTQKPAASSVAMPVSTVIGWVLRSFQDPPPSRVDQILSSAMSTPWCSSAQATLASCAGAEPRPAPGLTAVRGAEHGGRPRLAGCARRVAGEPGAAGAARGDRLGGQFRLLHHGPSGAAVTGREHGAGVGDEPAGARVGEGHVHASLWQEEALPRPRGAAVGGDQEDTGLARRPREHALGGRRRLPKGVARLLGPAPAAAPKGRHRDDRDREAHRREQSRRPHCRPRGATRRPSGTSTPEDRRGGIRPTTSTDDEDHDEDDDRHEDRERDKPAAAKLTAALFPSRRPALR